MGGHSTGEDMHGAQERRCASNVEHLDNRGRKFFITQHDEYTGRASVIKPLSVYVTSVTLWLRRDVG